MRQEKYQHEDDSMFLVIDVINDVAISTQSDERLHHCVTVGSHVDVLRVAQRLNDVVTPFQREHPVETVSNQTTVTDVDARIASSQNVFKHII